MFKKLICLLVCGVSHSAFSDIAIVVHPSNTAIVSQDDVKKLFSGRVKKFTDGQSAKPFNISEESPMRSEFDQLVLERSSTQMKSYWSKIVFTGKGAPPKELKSEGEIIEMISKEPSAIGYVNSSSVDSRVKVVLTIK